MSDGSPVRCWQPRPDFVSKDTKAAVDVAVKDMGQLLKASGEVNSNYERISQELPADVATFEFLEYTMCHQYVNGIITKEQYKSFTDEIMPRVRREAPSRAIEKGPIQATTPRGGQAASPASKAVQPASSCIDSDPSISCLWK